MRTQQTEFGRLRERQSSFLKIFQATGFDPSQKDNAARLAGYKSKNAGEIAMKSQTVRQLIARSMERRGLTPDLLVRTHKEVLRATKVVSVARDRKTGASVPVEVPDHITRLRAVELGYNVLGAMPSRTSVHLEKHETYNFDEGTLRRAEEVTGEKIIDVSPEAVEDDDVNRPF